jgi:hypothetical protein
MTGMIILFLVDYSLEKANSYKNEEFYSHPGMIDHVL